MKISIIVPMHNEENHIDRCIDALVNQKYEDLELILVDDHSEDATVEKCRQYCQKYPFIRLLQSDKRGVSEARNTGLKCARGEIVGFCDADDFQEPQTLKIVKTAFSSHPDIDILITGFYRTHIENNVLYKNKEKPVRRTFMNSEEAICHVLYDKRVMGSVWNKYFKSQLIRGVLFNPKLSYNEDTYFSIEALLKTAGKVLFIDVPAYNYVNNPHSVTHNPSGFFDAGGELKSIISMNAIEKDLRINTHIKDYVSSFRYRLSLMIYLDRTIELTDSQTEKINEHLKKDKLGFLRLFWVTGVKQNTKLLIKYFLKKMKLY